MIHSAQIVLVALMIVGLSVCYSPVAMANSHPIVPSESYSYAHNPYSFGYDVEDNYGNKQWKQERSINPHEVHGSYGYRDKTGVYREVTYVADKNGFRASIKTNEPGVAGTNDPASVNLDSYYSAQPVIPLVPSATSTNQVAVPIYAPKFHNSLAQPKFHQRS